MGLQFNVYDAATDTFVAEGVDMSCTTGKRLGDLLGLVIVTDTTAEGECTLAQLRAGLERCPETNHGLLINQRLAGLLRLLLAAENRNPDLNVTWG